MSDAEARGSRPHTMVESRTDPILPPSTIGILGGGQLGRYLVMAAHTMGYRTVVLEPDPSSPAGAVASEHLIAAYDDEIALDHLAATCAVVTTEFENPPARALHRLATMVPVRPSPIAIETTQDRRSEKQFLRSIGVPTAPFAVIETAADLPGAVETLAFPAILKTARMGYDGKGQERVDDGDELKAAWDRLGGTPCVLEQRLLLQREVSVVLARSGDGQFAAFDVATNIHSDGILDLTVVPDPIEGAVELAERIATALDYVGVLAVEMFVVDGELLVNELAPRPHNSGHWTLDVAATSQFEQQLRAVCGLPLGDPRRRVPAAAMVNLLGDVWDGGPPDWSAALATADAHLHLYGKTDARARRKMGHITVAAGTKEEALSLALACRSHARRRVQLDH
jgi:5-(carboxyamino)imidazole ribonucleotide synthase